VLVVVSLAQLMIALDATVMNVALPSAQADLGFSDSDREWMITAYTLAFGGLLLIGGRVSDVLGRRRAFLVGLTGFAAASGVAGAAPNLAVLVAARAAQGAFGALLAKGSPNAGCRNMLRTVVRCVPGIERARLVQNRARPRSRPRLSHNRLRSRGL
jgi:MFS family permease